MGLISQNKQGVHAAACDPVWGGYKSNEKPVAPLLGSFFISRPLSCAQTSRNEKSPGWGFSLLLAESEGFEPPDL